MSRRDNLNRFGRWKTVTISYREQTKPLATNRTGYGKTYWEAVADADSQLSDGLWKRVCVSNPSSIAHDLDTSRQARLTRRTMKQGEGIVIRVEKRIAVVLDAT